MNSAQRMITAMSGGAPDGVPVCPDTSNYIPCRYTAKPYWDIYFHNDPPLWVAYLNVLDRFGFDGWNTASWEPIWADYKVRVDVRLEYDSSRDAMLEHAVWHTPDGPLTATKISFRGEPPTNLEKPIKDLARHLPRWLWTVVPPTAVDTRDLEAVREEYRRRGQAFGIGMSFPGLQYWFVFVQDGLEALTYASVDAPELLDRWHERQMEVVVRQTELCLAQRPDYLFFGGSGSITLATPALARRYALPTLKAVTRMAREAGVPTMLHSCGKSWEFMRMLHDETDLCCFNPVELPPHGDAELAPAKQAYGDKLALMGNLHTTEVMLRGTPQLVRQRSLEAMRDAGRGGGFILSTGDQCPRDTPEENIHAMIEAARHYGRYDANGELPDVEAALRLTPAVT